MCLLAIQSKTETKPASSFFKNCADPPKVEHDKVTLSLKHPNFRNLSIYHLNNDI